MSRAGSSILYSLLAIRYSLFRHSLLAPWPNPHHPRPLQPPVQAVEHFRQGRLPEAEKLGARILKAVPHSYEALHLMGLIKLMQGRAARPDLTMLR